MTKILKVESVNDYAEYVGAKVLHPQVSIIHYDELGPVRHSLNNYGVYGLFLQREFPYNLTYGMSSYGTDEGSLIAVAPGQVGGVSDNGERIQLHGWALLFDPELIRGTELEKNISRYRFFSYYANEALMLTATEKRILVVIMKLVRRELAEHPDDPHTMVVVRAYIQLILEYCFRFYDRQFCREAKNGGDVLARFQTVLEKFYADGLQYENGTPSVKYCAGELFLSANYFGDLIRNATGGTATHYIRHFVVDRAKSLLISGKSVSETAYSLGFDYPQHFTRVFKTETGILPSQFVRDRGGGRDRLARTEQRETPPAEK